MSRRIRRKLLRRVGAVFVLAIVMTAGLAMMPVSAHAESCGSGLLTITSNCVAVAPPVTSSGDTKCVAAETACATSKPPETKEPVNVVQPVVPKPPTRVTPVKPKPVPPAAPSAPIRIRPIDADPWFTSGTYEPTLPYHLPRMINRIDADAYMAPARSRSIDLGSLAGPFRLGLMYAGLALLVGAVGVKRMLAIR